MAAKEVVVDFTNVKDGGGIFNKKHQPAGDYKAKVTKVEDSPSKKDGIGQWLFTIQAGAGTYPYYCKHQENQFWKVRNLLVAAGINVPKKKVKVNPNVLVGKTIAITLDDDEYDGKLQSNVVATFPLSELGDDVADDEDELEDELEDEVEDDEDEDEAPAPKKKKAPVVEDDDDEDEEDDEPAPPKKKKKKAKKVEVDDDELEELDIDDV